MFFVNRELLLFGLLKKIAIKDLNVLLCSSHAKPFMFLSLLSVSFESENILSHENYKQPNISRCHLMTVTLKCTIKSNGKQVELYCKPSTFQRTSHYSMCIACHSCQQHYSIPIFIIEICIYLILSIKYFKLDT